MIEDTISIALPKSWTEKLDELEVNQSIPVDEINVHACKIAASRLHKKIGYTKQFTTRTLKGTNEVHVWRKK
jgi:hypothetical protein